ncbi:MAG: hypothetical protein IJT51_04635 [Bacteroidales bacterium]|nr:hypothetical protein [Bacteroidales bacterium]
MKKVIIDTFPEHKSVFYLLMLLLISLYLFVSIIVLLLSDPISFKIVLKITIAFGIEILISLYLLDEILWQTRGEERIEYDSTYIYIEKTGRIFNKHERISIEGILDVNFREINPVWEFICYITVTGNAQDRLTILSKSGRRINCGWNLSYTACKNVIGIMRKLTSHIDIES